VLHSFSLLAATYITIRLFIKNANQFGLIARAATIVFNGFTLDNVGTYFGYELSLGFMALPFTVFTIIGFTNAVNLTNGLDGLAGSISVIILANLLLISVSFKSMTNRTS